MPLTDEAQDTVKARVGDWAQSMDAIDALVNNDTVPNPVPARQVLREFGWHVLAEFLALIGAARRNRVLHALQFARAVIDGERAEAASALADMVADGTVTTAERDAIVARAQEMIQDPTYRPNISWAESRLGRKIDRLELDAIRREVVG